MKFLREHATAKSITVIVLMLAVFSLVVSAIGFNGFTEALLTQYSDGAFMTAEGAAQILDGDRVDAYVQSGGEGEEYRAVWERLDQLCNSSGSTFIYLIQPDLTDYGHITFLFSTINHDSPYSVYSFGYYRETTNDDYREKYRALYELRSDKELVIRDKGYIETDPHITAMIALRDAKGETRAIICVQRQMAELAQVRRSYLGRVALALGILVVLVIVGQSVFLHRTLLQPLELMSREATRFSVENVPGIPKLKDRIKNEDEIGALAASIDRMEEQVQSYVENLTRITAERERMSTELELATRIQADMLPSVFPAFPEREEFDIFATMDPAKEVGGDFYDFFLVDDDHLCMLIADVSGKGVPAALFMMASKIILANNAMMGKPPAQILSDANNAICKTNREEMFVTVWLGILELSTGKLSAANAGHEYPALRRSDGRFELVQDEHGFVLGGLEDMPFSQYELQLEPGACLFVYTDGVPEATNARGELFGTDRMLAALNADPGAAPEKLLDQVKAAVDGFVQEAEQFDDLTMLGFAYKGKSKD